MNGQNSFCDVLAYLHSRIQPVIYRDMKPSNIMLKPDGKVMLIDFGTAREFKETSVADTTCLGTQGYAAPEQYGGQGQDRCPHRQYTVWGATLYHLLTGHNPGEPPYEMYPHTVLESGFVLWPGRNYFEMYPEESGRPISVLWGIALCPGTL